MSAVQPTKNTAKIVEEFIRYARGHLSTVSGIANTISVFPSVPSPITLPSIVNWTGYFVAPAAPYPAPLSDLQEIVEEEEGQAIKRDIEVEYPLTQQAYEDLFASEEEALQNNSNVTLEEALDNVEQFREEKSKLGSSDIYGGDNQQAIIYGSSGQVLGIKSTSSGSNGVRSPFGGDYPDSPTTKLVGKGDQALFNKCGNGSWPALGQPGNFEVRETETAGKCPRYWYKVNPEFLSKNCTEIFFPTAGGDKKIMVHKDLAAIVKPAIDRIKAAGLQKYIKNCAGGLAVRNVTCGVRLSNHSWGTAIDMNSSIYPYGYKFGNDGIYEGSTKKRDFDEFDLGFLEVAKIFQSVGMTWLKNNDPMHVSIYE